MKNRSDGSVVRSELGLKVWIEKTPTVDASRPAACPVGGLIQLHGHGLRARQVRGPAGLNARPGVVPIEARRYRCLPCGAVVVVLPFEVVPRRHYSASAIGFALALWGLVRETARAVRRRVSGASSLGFDATGWVTLRRWATAVRGGRLFASVPAAAPSATLREVAAVAATGLAASADSTTRHLPIEQRAFLGAAHAA